MSETPPSHEIPHNFGFGDVVEVEVYGGFKRAVVLEDLGYSEYDHQIATSFITETDEGEKLNLAGSQGYEKLRPTAEEAWDKERIIQAQIRFFNGAISEDAIRAKLEDDLERSKSTFRQAE